MELTSDNRCVICGGDWPCSHLRREAEGAIKATSIDKKSRTGQRNAPVLQCRAARCPAYGTKR